LFEVAALLGLDVRIVLGCENVWVAGYENSDQSQKTAPFSSIFFLPAKESYLL